MGDHIYYRRIIGYKYELHDDYSLDVGILGFRIETEYLKLSEAGVLTIKAGYAWDGPSGPTIDTKDFMRGSLVHDALYQMIRERLLPPKYKDTADHLLREICLEDGMPDFRSNYIYLGVNKFGGSSCIPGSQKSKEEVCVAP